LLASGALRDFLVMVRFFGVGCFGRAAFDARFFVRAMATSIRVCCYGRQTWPGPSAIVMHFVPAGHGASPAQLISHDVSSGPLAPAMPK
jgi:hypothetical protein